MTIKVYHPVKIIGGVAAILTLAEVFGEVSKDFYKYKVLAKPTKERKRRIETSKLVLKKRILLGRCIKEIQKEVLINNGENLIKNIILLMIS